MIGSPDEFKKTIHKFAKHGYDHVESKLYPQMRHEILNEINRQQVYDDVLEFMERTGSKTMKAAIIGFGKMGQAIAKGWIDKKSSILKIFWLLLEAMII